MTFIPTIHIYRVIAFPAILGLEKWCFRLAKWCVRLDFLPPQAGHFARPSKNRNCYGF